jgi:hypothetical protein
MARWSIHTSKESMPIHQLLSYVQRPTVSTVIMLTKSRRIQFSIIQTNLTKSTFANHCFFDIIVFLKVFPDGIPILIEVLVSHFLIIPMVVMQYVE